MSHEVRYPGRVASRGRAYGTLRRDRASAVGGQEPAQGVIAAIVAAAGQLEALQTRTHGLGADILAFQRELLEDDQLALDLLQAADAAGSPTAAIKRVFGEQIALYEGAASEQFASRAADLTDLRDRLLQAFAGTSETAEAWPEGTILLVEDMTPSRFLGLDRAKLAGIVDRHGSTASHVALLARSEGLPMVVGIGAAERADEGMPVLLDAEQGELIVAPAATAETPAPGSARADDAADRADAARPAILPSGETVAVQLTVNALDALDEAPAEWFDGIGLVRTELLIRDAHALRDAAAQAALYRPLFAWAGALPVTIRLLDAGGDKQVPGLAPAGDGGFLGVRGARLLRQQPEILRTQLAAIVRAAQGRPVRIMVPMITLPEEMGFFRAELGRVLADSDAPDGSVALGMMVETPAAALQIAEFDADFFGLGTNDLTQYTLAASRDGDGLAVGHMPEAVLELVRRVVTHAGAADLPVTVCGDVAATPDALGRLVACGVRSFSLPPRLAPAFKQSIRKGW